MVDHLSKPLDSSYSPSYNWFNYVAESRGGPPKEGEEVDWGSAFASLFTNWSFWFTFGKGLTLLPWLLLRFGWKIYGEYILVDISRYIFE